MWRSNELDPSAIDVRVENGIVSLTGTVATRFEKRLAEQIADSVPGVADVDNRLTIGNPISHPPSGQGLAGSAGQTTSAAPVPVGASQK